MKNKLSFLFYFVCAIILLSSCSSVPSGYLDVDWGENISEAENKINCHPKNWSEWFTDKRFMVGNCDTTEAFGKKATLKLVKENEKFVGALIHFTDYDVEGIRKKIIDYYNLDAGDESDIYIISSSFSGKAERLIRFDDKTCDLVLAGNDFAEYYKSYQLQQGFQNLSNGLRAH